MSLPGLSSIDHILMESFNLSFLQIGGVNSEQQLDFSVFNQQADEALYSGSSMPSHALLNPTLDFFEIANLSYFHD